MIGDRRRIQHVVIVMPACNEEELLADALTGVHRARRRVHPAVITSVVVVADACTDATATIARSRAAASDMVVETTSGCVGHARRRGTERGLRRTAHTARGIWIASTDADTVVPPDWLVTQLEYARRGAIGVAGNVTLAPADVHDPIGRRLRDDFHRSYLLDDGGTHRHIHGANLGMRADAYLRAGGWRDLATAEDHDLWRRLQRIGHTVSTTAIPVVTSARRRGRAPHGFAAGLDELAVAVA
jgi:glycosyltransferase involved in cell wall biosynthesis